VARVSAGVVAVDVTAAEAASARVCLLSGAHTLSSARRMLTGRALETAACSTTSIAQNRRARVVLARHAGRVTLAVRLVAETNAARTTTVVRRLG
jgi:hypothetical protein